MSTVQFNNHPTRLSKYQKRKLPKTRAARSSPMQTAFKTYFLPLQTFRGSIYPLVGKETEGENASVSIGARETRVGQAAGVWWHGFEISGAPACPWFGYVAACGYVRSTRRLVTVLEAPRRRLQDYTTPMLKSRWSLLTREKRRENTQRIAVAIVSLKERNRKEKKREREREKRKFSLSRSLGP